MNSRKHLTWYFDVVSPFAYLALPQIEELSLDHDVIFRPVLLGGLLKHWGQLGPAEIPPKRLQTYRLCVWEAERRRIPFRFPPAHPFNPLRLLRLLTALDAQPRSVRAIMDTIWRHGHDPDLDQTWIEICGAVGLNKDEGSALASGVAAKTLLRAHTDEAVKKGIFGVPTLRVDDQLFWGLDMMPMALAFLGNPSLFRSGELSRVATIGRSAARVSSGP